MDNPDKAAQRLDELRADFLNDLKAMKEAILADLDRIYQSSTSNDVPALENLRRVAHRLGGGAGVFGYHDISDAGIELETEITRAVQQPSRVYRAAETLAAVIENALNQGAGDTVHESGASPTDDDAPIRITYVEDEPDIREIGKMSLEGLGGFTVNSCANGYEALDSTSQFPPDLIILDVMMPGMDGVETFERLREQSDTSETPIIFMTARVQDEELAAYRELGCADIITKPFDPIALPERVREIWQRDANARAADGGVAQ